MEFILFLNTIYIFNRKNYNTYIVKMNCRLRLQSVTILVNRD